MGIRTKSSEIEVPKEHPFKNDKLKRKPVADMLTRLISNMPTPFVLGIDSEWGTGKTTFVRMWKASLEKQGFHCIYFNAWTSDFAEDPFISFVGSIKKEFGKSASITRMMTHAKNLGRLILKKGLPVATRLATAGIVDLNPDIENALSTASEDIVEQAIEDFEKTENATLKFKQSLQEIVKRNESGEIERPTILFVDELDRCRPSYALQLLERIKHVFSTEGYVFVLSLDRKQLGTSLRSLYGSETNAEAYLRRIIDLDYVLPTPERGEFISSLINANMQELLRERNISIPDIRRHIEFIANLTPLSLRDMEHYFVVLETILASYRDIEEFPASYLLLLLGLRISDKNIYEQVVAGNPSAAKSLIANIQRYSKSHSDLESRQRMASYVQIANCTKDNLDGTISQFMQENPELAQGSGRFGEHLKWFWYSGGRENIRTYTDRLIKTHLRFS